MVVATGRINEVWKVRYIPFASAGPALDAAEARDTALKRELVTAVIPPDDAVLDYACAVVKTESWISYYRVVLDDAVACVETSTVPCRVLHDKVVLNQASAEI